MFSFLFYLLALGLIKAGLSQQKKGRPQYKIVGFKDKITFEEGEGILLDYGIKIKKHLPLANACLCLLDEISAGFKSLAADDNIEFIEDDYLARIQVLASTTETLKIASQNIPWGVRKIEAPDVWKRCQGEGIKVGIIDTGIDLGHPDLKDNIKEAYSVVDGASADDDNGHGTHVAGIIAALDNDIGVVGVAPKAEIYSVKAFDKMGRGTVSDIIDALQWCVENKVHVINMSFGIGTNSRALKRAIGAAHRHKIIMVAAAGNSGARDSVLYPAKYPEVIAVAASDSKDQAADFSSRGPEVNIIAPGVDVSSTYINEEYKNLSGTSMACPHVVGACALLMSISGTKAESVKKAILSTAKDIGLPEETQGVGLVNVSAAVSNIKKLREASFMSNKFEELKKEIRDSMETLDEISDVFKKFGISPENPEVLNQLITDAGLNAEELNPERAAELVQKMTESLPPEMKKYMADMIESISGAITDLPMPDDVKRLMDSWKGGEGQGEETN